MYFNKKNMNSLPKIRLASLKHHLVSLIAIAFSTIALATVLVVVVTNGDNPIAVVRSPELIQGFKAMKDAQARYGDKQKAWQANLETLEEDLQSAMNEYRAQYARLSNDEVQKRREQLEQKRSNYEEYSRALQEKAAEEENTMMQGVLNQINSFVMDYGEEHGYEVILGTTSAGSVLYGRETVDITDEILKALNAAYESGNMGGENVSQ